MASIAASGRKISCPKEGRPCHSRAERAMMDLPGQTWEKKGDGDKGKGHLPPPFGFPPMMTPEMMMKFPPPPFPPGMMPPPPPGMIPPPLANVGRGGFGGGRGRDSRGRDGRDAEITVGIVVIGTAVKGRTVGGVAVGGGGAAGGFVSQAWRKQYFILAMRNVPEDKLKLPHILRFFEKYGTPDNVHIVTPDRAFIICDAQASAGGC